MANGRENIIPNTIRTTEEARKRGRNGGKASGEARRRKKTIKEGIKAMMEEGAPDKVKAAFLKNGFDIDSNYDAIVASIMMGAIKGNPKMVDKVIQMAGEDIWAEARKAEAEIAKERLKIEKQKAELEAEKQRIWAEAVKAHENAQMEDDGFIEALKGTAKDDWSDADDN